MMKWSLKTRAALAAALAAGTLLAGPAWARTNHALIVAVSKYPNLSEDKWLNGPVNDAKLVRQYLLEGAPLDFEESEITVLADGIEGAAEPTGDHIREAFASLAEEVEPGDFVFLHFSGHGSQAPALVPGSEQDGMDELFLPADISGWDQATGTVPNALVDDELGAMITALTDKGANIWAIFDSCHSGTVTRAAPSGDPLDAEKSRDISPAALGIPQDVLDAVEPIRTRSGTPEPEIATIETTGSTEGQQVFFYAAQTNETTPEMRLPADDPDRVSHGLFTFTLFETLAQNPALTYRQLGEEVLRRYSIGYRVQPTPLFEGALDAPVFGAADGQAGRIQQWPVKQDGGKRIFSAGRLHGISVGDELALLDSPAVSDDEKIATIRVTATSDFRSEFEIVDGGFVMLDTGFYARKAQEEMRFSIAVAKPDLSEAPEATRAEIDAVIEALVNTEKEGLRLDMVEPGDNADIYLQVADGALWLVPRGGELVRDGANKTTSIGFADRETKETTFYLADSLSRIARVANLLKLGGGSGTGGAGLEISYSIQYPDSEERIPIAPPSIPRIEPGAIVWVEVGNKTNRPLDLNILYTGVNYSIDHMFNDRFLPGESRAIDLLDVIEGDYGRERLIAIVTPVEPQSVVADFGWLSQPELGKTRAVARGGFNAMLEEAGFGEKTRAVRKRSRDDAGGGISQVAVETVPPGSVSD